MLCCVWSHLCISWVWELEYNSEMNIIFSIQSVRKKTLCWEFILLYFIIKLFSLSLPRLLYGGFLCRKEKVENLETKQWFDWCKVHDINSIHYSSWNIIRRRAKDPSRQVHWWREHIVQYGSRKPIRNISRSHEMIPICFCSLARCVVGSLSTVIWDVPYDIDSYP